MRSNRMTICLFGIISCGIFLSPIYSAQAQPPTPTPSPTPRAAATPSLERQFFNNILDDQKAIWTSPFHMHGRDLRWMVPLGLGTAALIATDRRTGDEMGEFHKQLNMSRIVSYAGSTYGDSGVAATFYLIGRAKHDDRARATGLLCA